LGFHAIAEIDALMAHRVVVRNDDLELPVRHKLAECVQQLLESLRPLKCGDGDNYFGHNAFSRFAAMSHADQMVEFGSFRERRSIDPEIASFG
jgi:hypothetical protein